MLKRFKQAIRRDNKRQVRRSPSISIMNASETLEPPTTGMGQNVYLKGRHFLMMMGAALAFHLLAIYGLELWPHEEVTQVPVRSMNLKLGDDEDTSKDKAGGVKGAASDNSDKPAGAGGGTGAGSGAASAPAVANKAPADVEKPKAPTGPMANISDEGLPDQLPQVAPDAPAKPQPKTPPVNPAALPTPALPMQKQAAAPDPNAPPASAPALEKVDVAMKPIAAVANKPVMPKVSASTTQNLADLPLMDKNFPRNQGDAFNPQLKNQKLPLTTKDKRKQEELLKAEKLKQEQLKAEKLKQEKLKAEQIKKMQLQKKNAPQSPPQPLERADVSDQQVAAAGAEGKRYLIGQNGTMAQQPIPANVPAPTFRLPLPKPGAQTPEALGALPPAPAIAPHPTQYVRANDAAPTVSSAAAVAAGITNTPSAPLSAPAPTASAPVSAPTPTMGAVPPAATAPAAVAPAAGEATGAAGGGAGVSAAANAGSGGSGGLGKGSGAGASQSASEKAAAEVKHRYEATISQWIAKHKVYPAGALLLGQHGKVVIRLRIDRGGNVKFSGIEQSSGFKLIDRAALDMVARANPVPAVPGDYPPGALLEFLVPASFDLQ